MEAFVGWWIVAVGFVFFLAMATEPLFRDGGKEDAP